MIDIYLYGKLYKQTRFIYIKLQSKHLCYKIKINL